MVSHLKEDTVLPKVSKEQVLEDERRVINILRTHAKDSIDSIAKRCKFSPQKVSRIIAKLEREKRIWGYSAVVDDDYLEMRHYYLLLRRTKILLPQNIVDEILLTRLDDLVPGSVITIDNIEYVNGDFDGVFSFWAKDIAEAKRFVEKMNIRFHPYLMDFCLLESVYSVRRKGHRNPNINKNINLPFVDDSVKIKGSPKE